MNRKTLNLILVGSLLACSVIALFVFNIASKRTVISENKLTGQAEIGGAGAPKDSKVAEESGYESTLLSDQTIFGLGLRSSEYHALTRALTQHSKQKFGEKKHVVYTIDPTTVKLDDTTNTFTFRLEVGKDSGKFYDVTLERPKFNYLIVTLRDDGEVVYNHEMKVNTRL